MGMYVYNLHRRHGTRSRSTDSPAISRPEPNLIAASLAIADSKAASEGCFLNAAVTLARKPDSATAFQ